MMIKKMICSDKRKHGREDHMEQALEQLQRWIDGSDNIVFFGGAGGDGGAAAPRCARKNPRQYSSCSLLSHQTRPLMALT